MRGCTSGLNALVAVALALADAPRQEEPDESNKRNNRYRVDIQIVE
jgi:hypothetical protein